MTCLIPLWPSHSARACELRRPTAAEDGSRGENTHAGQEQGSAAVAEGAAGGGGGGRLPSAAAERSRLGLPASATEAPGGGAAPVGGSDRGGVAAVRRARGSGRAEGPSAQQEAGEWNSSSTSSSISGS